MTALLPPDESWTGHMKSTSITKEDYYGLWKIFRIWIFQIEIWRKNYAE